MRGSYAGSLAVGFVLLLGAFALPGTPLAAQTPAKAPALSEKAQRGKDIFS